jgi:hypothetical protein
VGSVYRSGEGEGGLPPWGGWEEVDDGSREGKEEGRPVPGVPVEPVPGNITWQQLEEGEEDVLLEDGGVFCRNQGGVWTRIERGDGEFCDGKADCKSGQDEAGCSMFVPVTLGTVLGIVTIGAVAFLVHAAAQRRRGRGEGAADTSLAGRTELEVAADTFIAEASMENQLEDSPEDAEALHSAYTTIHAIPGGVKLLVGATFTFHLQPMARHRVAAAIRAEEERIHGGRQHHGVRGAPGQPRPPGLP